MGSKTSKAQEKHLFELQKSCGDRFPGYDYRPLDRKTWLSGLNIEKLYIHQIVWPGSHNSATTKIGFPLIVRPLAECQNLSIYKQLVLGTRVLDIRVQKNGCICHGAIVGRSIDFVIEDIKKFLSETQSEIIILEIRTEFKHKDPPNFDKYLLDQLGEFLIHQDDRVFGKTIAEVLPKRIICVWKPKESPRPKAGSPLWNEEYLVDKWTDTDLPLKKFEKNLEYLSKQPPASSRKYFYRVENTLTPSPTTMASVDTLNQRIQKFSRLFINQCFSKCFDDRLQIFSTDFIDESFVDACAGITHARIEGIRKRKRENFT